jgi:hypothetical protein
MNTLKKCLTINFDRIHNIYFKNITDKNLTLKTYKIVYQSDINKFYEAGIN